MTDNNNTISDGGYNPVIIEVSTKLNYQKCDFCGNHSCFFAVLPYGSKFDGDCICAECVNKHLDNILASIRE